MRKIVSYAHPAAIALGFLLSPESLARLGNGIGENGSLFIGLLVLSALVQLSNASSYDRLQHFLEAAAVESNPLGSLLGRHGSRLIPLAFRLPAFVCFSTAVLATAGFVFNEVLVYWFPNFAFAFLMLGFLLLLGILSPRGALILQTVFATTAVLGLISLSVAGLAAWSAEPLGKAAGTHGLVGVRPVFSCLSLFIGFELSLYGPPTQTKPYPASRFTVVLAAVLLLLWSVISIHVVPVAKLADSSVPHMVTARMILGETGRMIMGIVVLAGCCGVLNGVFLALYGLASSLARPDEPDDPATPRTTPGRIAIVLVGGATAAALGFGLAGESELEVWLRGSILLWLLGYAIFNMALCVLISKASSKEAMHRGVFHNRAWVQGGCFALLVTVLTGFVWTDPERGFLLAFLVVAPLVACIILLPWRRIATRCRDRA